MEPIVSYNWARDNVGAGELRCMSCGEGYPEGEGGLVFDLVCFLSLVQKVRFADCKESCKDLAG